MAYPPRKSLQTQQHLIIIQTKNIELDTSPLQT